MSLKPVVVVSWYQTLWCVHTRYDSDCAAQKQSLFNTRKDNRGQCVPQCFQKQCTIRMASLAAFSCAR